MDSLARARETPGRGPAPASQTRATLSVLGDTLLSHIVDALAEHSGGDRESSLRLATLDQAQTVRGVLAASIRVAAGVLDLVPTERPGIAIDPDAFKQ